MSINNKCKKSVLKPIAQSNTQCETRTFYEVLLNAKLKEVNRSKLLSVNEKLIIKIILHTGCRVSESLKINGSNLVGNCMLLIKSLKHSEQRLIKLDSKLYRELVKETAIRPLGYDTDRFRVYRIMKNLGIGKRFGTNKNSSVTHAIRHFIALHMKEKGVDIRTIQKFLGHKTIKSTMVYLRQ